MKEVRCKWCGQLLTKQNWKASRVTNVAKSRRFNWVSDSETQSMSCGWNPERWKVHEPEKRTDRW